MPSLTARLALLLSVLLGMSGCGDQSQNCAPPCWWGVRVHNATQDVVLLVLREEPRETTSIRPGETAAINYVMPRYGDLAREFRVFRALDPSDRTVFCRPIAWSTLKQNNRVEIRAGEIEC